MSADTCTECNGSGLLDQAPPERTCDECEGTGLNGPGYLDDRQKKEVKR
jgi:DnaJ-class molecular chaperone